MSHPDKTKLESDLQSLRDTWQDINYEIGCHWLVDRFERDGDWKQELREMRDQQEECRKEINTIKAELALS